MNKNLLIKQNNELFNRIAILKNSNNALNLKVANLNLEIESYKQKIEALENELGLLKSEKAVTPQEVQAEEPCELPLPTEPTKKEEVELPEEFIFASDVIGNIVIKAAASIENLNNSQNENKKELINLILGKTEIAKAEILNIVSSEVTFEAKKDLINTQYNEAYEYFKSVLEQ